MTKVLLIGAGAGFSTKDVELGYYEAFEDMGLELSYYCLDQRLFTSRQWLMYQWKHFFKKDPARRPGWADVVYRGGIEALEMALRYDVDLVFVISAMYLHPDILIMMRRAGLKVGILLTESPYQDDQQLKFAQWGDFIFTNERTSVDFFRRVNPHTYYLRHAYSQWRHCTNNGTAVTRGAVQIGGTEVVNAAGHDVVLVGTGFQERIDLLNAVDWTGIDLGLYGNWALLPSRHRLRKFVKGGVQTNKQTHDLYRNSKIGLNLYRTSRDYNPKSEMVEVAESMNPRAYELAAAGIFSLTQVRREGLETLRGSQPTFLDPASLEQQIRQFLVQDSARDLQAKEALGLIQGHTFVERAKEVLEHAIG